MVRPMDRYIDEISNELKELSLKIHSHPEIAFKEVKAHKWLTEYLESKGFKIETVKDMDTAFLATFDTGKTGENLAYLAEYDALEIGHACGHNLIAMMSVGAGIALSQSPHATGIIYVIGTPAEEGGGGKVHMIEKGVFDNIDYALMIHPATENLIMRDGLATKGYSITYHGKAAHSAAAENGVNALSAVILTFNLIDQMRCQLPNGTNINGIITEGGIASNIIPERASCKFSVRARTSEELLLVHEKIDHVVESVNNLVGTTCKIKRGMMYTERYPNQPIAETLKLHMKTYGVEMKYPPKNMKVGSSDIGNVSKILPTIHSYLNIWDGHGDKPVAHSDSFTEASKSEYALNQMIIGAKALSKTGESIMMDEELRKKINEYHKNNVK